MSRVDLVGIGIGPFNLSLAALLEKAPEIRSVFLEKKSQFDWHPEVMFPDSTMQTSYLKDLVTPVDPTSPYSFLNYLVEHHLFYPFLNTQRSVVSRREFEQYCSWVAEKLAHKFRFQTEVERVEFDGKAFQVESSAGRFESESICVATGLSPRIPECAKSMLGAQVFHAKSAHLKDVDLTGKKVVVIGGGQTGIEVFRNALHGRWGRVRDIDLITRRKSLEPLDESAFTNEFFTPNYVKTFWELKLEKKAEVVASQKLASDGNTPTYLSELYNDLYRLKHVEKDPRGIRILACRELLRINRDGDQYRLSLKNTFLENEEGLTADVIILSTGFQNAIPKVLEPLFSRIHFDGSGRLSFRKSYAIDWEGPEKNRIYALNFSRHNHGIIDPQTSLMAWRSAVVVNDLARKSVYATEQRFENFIEYGAVSL